MKRLLFLGLISLSGCSTIGNLEVLNDIGLGEVRQTAKTLDRTIVVLNGKSRRSYLNTGAINRKYGELKGLNNRKYNFHDIPLLIQSLRYIIE